MAAGMVGGGRGAMRCLRTYVGWWVVEGIT